MTVLAKKLLTHVNIGCFYLFLKTPNRRETQRHSKWRLNFVLSSHLDPIGDRNDVRELLFLFSMLGLRLLFSPHFISIRNLSSPPPRAPRRRQWPSWCGRRPQGPTAGGPGPHSGGGGPHGAGPSAGGPRRAGGRHLLCWEISSLSFC